MSDAPQGASASPPKGKRVAVVFIHGQGEQRPMEDVQELARTVWEGDPAFSGPGGGPRRTWTVPDSRVGMADVGRVTTDAGVHDTRVDFFEFYWAHLMEGNRLGHILNWFVGLQMRPRAEVAFGLRMVRQWLIRATESVVLLSLLYAVVTALTLPPETASRSVIGGALTHAGVWIPAPADDAVILGGVAIILLAIAFLRILSNEIAGGAKRVRSKASLSLGQVRRKARIGMARMLVVIAVVFLLAALLFIVAIRRGPSLEWGDARVGLFVLVTASAWMLFARRLQTAAVIGLIAAVTSLIASLFGGVDPANVFDFGKQSTLQGLWQAFPDLSDAVMTFDARCFSQISVGGRVQGCGSLMSTPQHIFSLALYAIQIFACFWFLAGLRGEISAALNPLVRLFWTSLIVAASIGAAAFLLLTGFADPPFQWLLFSLGAALTLLVLIGGLTFLVARDAFLVPVMADSARYLSREPESIAARQKIREAGVRLLNQLHSANSGASYDRIVIVAHSLGSVVGYELLMDYWARVSGAYQLEMHPSLKAAVDRAEIVIERLNTMGGAEGFEEFRTAQSEIAAELAKIDIDNSGQWTGSGRWLVTDFVTLGSPLTHASLLIADGPEDLAERQKARKLATCPPLAFEPVQGQVEKALTYQKSATQTKFAHSAIFGAVRWTNLYFKTGRFLLAGDLIGGPLHGLGGPNRIQGGMGHGVCDVPLDRIDTGAVFAHNEYWRSALRTEALRKALSSNRPPRHIRALIEALALH